MTRALNGGPPAAPLTGAEAWAIIQSGVDVTVTADEVNSLPRAIASITGLQAALDAKATDSAVVKLAGAQTVTGDKTYTGGVIVKADAVFDVRGYTGWNPIAANNDAAFTAALAAALAAGGGDVLLPRELKIAANHSIGQGVNLIGPGGGSLLGAARVLCTHASAGLTYGDVATARTGGISRGFTVDADGVATNPFYVGVDVGRTFMGIDVLDSADANLVLQGTQNCVFINFNCQGGPDQVRIERGAMTNLFLRCEFNDATRYNCRIRVNGAAPVPIGSNLPSYNHFLRCIFERGAGGVGTVVFLHDAGLSNCIDSCILADGGGASIPTTLKITKAGSEDSTNLAITGDTTLQANVVSASSVALDLGNGTKVIQSGALHFVGHNIGVLHDTAGYMESTGYLNLASVTTPTSGPAFYADALIRENRSFGSLWERPAAEQAVMVRQPGDTQSRLVIYGNGDIYRGNGTATPVRVIGVRGASVADAAGGATVDTEARAAINTLLSRMRTHGLIET